MVPIDLTPEIVIHAQRARYRARNIVLEALAVSIACIGLICGRHVFLWMSVYDAQLAKQLTEELDTLSQTINARRREVAQQELQVGKLLALRASQTSIAERLTGIPGLIPRHVTLSSIQIAEHKLVLAGVASERSVVGDLVSSLREDAPGSNISVERLTDVSVDRHTLQDFVVSETPIKVVDKPTEVTQDKSKS